MPVQQQQQCRQQRYSNGALGALELVPEHFYMAPPNLCGVWQVSILFVMCEIVWCMSAFKSPSMDCGPKKLFCAETSHLPSYIPSQCILTALLEWHSFILFYHSMNIFCLSLFHQL